MKILHIVNYYSSKVKYQEYFLAKEQILEGHEVFFITSDRNFPVPNYDETVKKIYGERIIGTGFFYEQGVRIFRLPILFELGARVLLRGLSNKIKEISPDLIISHGILQFHTLTLLYTELGSTRWIIDEHMLHSDIYDSPLKKNVYKYFGILFGKRLERKTEKIVGISDGTIQLLVSVLKLNSIKVKLIPLGVDTNIFYPDLEKRKITRNKFHVNDNCIIIAYTGKVAYYKKVHHIIDAVQDFENKNILILIVGNIASNYYLFLKDRAMKSLVLVKFLDAVKQDELPFIYNASDILVWPAHQTIATLEASACGKPIICSDYLKERYENGMGFGVGREISDLKDKLLVLVNNEDVRQEMSKKALENVKNKFCWRKVNNKFLS
jgi:glycosyltransferase involved in cell wall biosynthesis